MRRYTWLSAAVLMLGLFVLGVGSPVATSAASTAEPTINATAAATVNFAGRIAFVAQTSSDTQLYIMNADGSKMRQLTNDDLFSWNPVFSPDGKHIAFVAKVDKHYQIFMMDSDGSNKKQLTKNPAGQSGISGLDWSKDGKQLLFAYQPSDDPNVQSYDLYVMNTDGSAQRNITNHPMDGVRSPRWSPDGKQIVFEAVESSPDVKTEPATGNPIIAQLYIINADGTDLHRLTESDHNEFYPAWSPDGKWIVYLSAGKTESDTGLFRVNADGTAPVQLSDKTYYMAAWSPDGKYLAVVFNEGFTQKGVRYSNIYVLNADGSNPVKLTDTQDQYKLPTWGN